MFHFPGCTLTVITPEYPDMTRDEFPHSEIAGSKVARHLPDAYRSHATSFIVTSSLGIHHTLLVSAPI